MPAARSRAACLRSFLYCAAARLALAFLSPTHCLPNPTTGVMVKARPLPALPFTGQVPFTESAPLPRLPMVWCALGRIMVSLSVVDVEGGSAAGRLADLTHGHGEAVAVGLGDLQTRAQGVAANVEAEGEGRQGEDEALHWSFAVDALSIEAGGWGCPPYCATCQTATGLWRMGTSNVLTSCPLIFAQPYIRASSLDTNFCLNVWATLYLKYVLPLFTIVLEYTQQLYPCFPLLTTTGAGVAFKGETFFSMGRLWLTCLV